LPQYVAEGVNISQPATNGLTCTTCHTSLTEFTILETPEVEFPSGATVSFGEDDLASNLCINCHQGRESGASVAQLIGDQDDDTVSESLRFLNIHYYAAGATLFGSEVGGGYEYEGQEYAGRNEHVPGFDSCAECHDVHALKVVAEECGDCHEGVSTEEDLVNIRVREDDFDGDGDVEEGIAGEIETMREKLYAAIQVYAAETAGTAIVYDSHAYPYWFADTDGNGEVNGEEGRYASWTPRLLRAAYNYQDASKDPGAFAHNSTYIMQLLYDSISDLGGDTTGMTRAVPPPPES
jgi:hypothetical protein